MADSQLLAPWEYEGDIPQIIEAGELVWQGCPVRFELLRGQEQVVIVGPSWGESEMTHVNRLVFRTGADDGSWTIPLKQLHLPVQLIPRHICRVLENGRSVRNFWIGSKQIQISSQGTGCWGNDNPIELTNLQFSLGRRISQMTSSQTYEWLQTLLARPSSDVSFAMQFGELKAEHRRIHTFGVTTEEQLASAQKEMEVLCSRVFHTEVVLWNHETQINWVLMGRSPENPDLFRLHGLRQNDVNLHDRLNMWARVLARFGPLQPQLDRLCVRQFFNSQPLLSWGKCARPTAHERIEARFQLRDWAQQHLPPDVWAELERFDAQ